MGFFTLPISSDEGYYSFDVELEGEIYIFYLRYNNRAEKWVISMYDSNEDPIFQGLYLVLGYDYFNSFYDSRLPSGNLVLVNIESANEEPTRDNLGTNCKLLYYEA